MPGQYAKTTDVSSNRTVTEIEHTLKRYGATSFGFAWNEGKAVVAFEARDRQMRFTLPLPDRQSEEYTHHSRGSRSAEAAEKLWEQATRARWRALLLVIKAKLEAVEVGILTFEQAFQSDIVLPDGRTVGEWMEPQVVEAYRTRLMPPLMLALGPGREA